MESKDDNDRITLLESINERLDSLDKKIGKLPDKKVTERYFIASLLVSLAFVLVAVTIPLLTEILGYTKEELWWIVIPYMAFIFVFMIIAAQILSKKIKNN